METDQIVLKQIVQVLEITLKLPIFNYCECFPKKKG